MKSATSAIGQKTSEQLEYVPAKLIVIRHVCSTYAYRSCGGEVETAVKPNEAIPKCLAAPGLLAHVIVSKFDDHLPVYRQEEILKRSGIEISRSTMYGWLMGCAAALLPVYKLMHQRILRSRVIQTDGSTLPTMDPGRGSTRGSGFWVYRGDDRAPYVAYGFTEGQDRTGPVRWLKGFSGTLQAEAVTAMAWIRKLYAIEDIAKTMSKRRRRPGGRDPVGDGRIGEALRDLLDPAAVAVWEAFDDRYRPIIVGFARRLGLADADAADLAQETLTRFVEAYRAGRYDRERGRLRSWIIGVARHVMSDMRASAGKQRQWRGHSALDLLADDAELTAIWEAERQAVILALAMDELRAHTRISDNSIRAFEMVAFEGRSAEEAAAALDMTRHDVYVAKHRVTGRLRGIVARLESLFSAEQSR